MKKQLTILILTIIIVIGASYGLNYIFDDGTDSKTNINADAYCAVIKGNKLLVMYNGKEITEDVMLSNGTKIRKDGIVVKKDGTQTTLKEGECIDLEGEMKKDDKTMPDDKDSSMPQQGDKNMPYKNKSDSMN